MNFEEKASELFPVHAHFRPMVAQALRDAHESGRTEAMKLIDGRAEAAYREGYEAGAAAMRERAANSVIVGAGGFDMSYMECAEAIRELPLAEEGKP